MTFRAMLTRPISIVPRTPGARDAHGNPVLVEGDAVPADAHREQVSSEEDERTGEGKVTRYVYFLLPDAPVDARSIIVDGTDRFEVKGEPSVEGRPGRPHHLELVVEKATG